MDRPEPDSNGVAAMEAEHTSRAVDGPRAGWERRDAPGRVTGRTMGVAPSAFRSHAPDDADAPTLEFDATFVTTGEATVEVRCLPTQSLGGDRDLRYAFSVGDGPRETGSLDPAGGEHDPT